MVPGLLYLGDLSDAAALPRLREQLNIQAAVTALAELTPSLKAAVKESGVEHTWCNVRAAPESRPSRARPLFFAHAAPAFFRARRASLRKKKSHARSLTRARIVLLRGETAAGA